MKQKLTPAKLALISMVFGLLMIAALFARLHAEHDKRPGHNRCNNRTGNPGIHPGGNSCNCSPDDRCNDRDTGPGLHSVVRKFVAFTAASLTGASKTIGPSFTAAYPGTP